MISSRKLIDKGIDIAALQEPSINFLGKTVAPRDWIPIYPTTHEKDQNKTRTITLMNSKLPTESWEQIDFPSGDVVVVKITGEWGQIVIFNIYNDCQHNRTINKLMTFYRTNCGMLPEGQGTETETKHAIWLGDFNRHHPAWDSPEDHCLFTRKALEEAKTLLRAVADHGMEMALPPGVSTHIHNVTKKWSRLDQVFVTEHTLDRILTCKAHLNNRGLNTDHVPIVTKIDVSLAQTADAKTKNFRDVDWDKFRKALEEQIAEMGIPRRLSGQSCSGKSPRYDKPSLKVK